MKLASDTTHLPVIALVAATILPVHALADDITLRSSDGTVNLTGEFLAYQDQSYIVRTPLGDLRIAASRVRCEGAACPSIETSTADVIIAGSDTVGLGIMPLLMEGYAAHLSAEAAVVSTARDGEILANLVAQDGFGDPIGSYLVTPTNSGDAFQTLTDGTAHIGMSSRRIRPDEAEVLRASGAGDMISPEQEHIIAIDSLVVVTHPDNPITEMTMDQLRGIYAGAITNWAQLGGSDAPIKVITRQDNSATRTLFENTIFGDAVPAGRFQAEIAQDSSQMATMVNADPLAIGFVGYAFQRGAKPVTLINDCGIAMTPDAFSAKTEEYALQQRLYLYNRADDQSDVSAELVSFASSDAADAVIAKSGFIDLGIKKRSQQLDSHRAAMLRGSAVAAPDLQSAENMLADMVKYDRLSTTFRFPTGSASLDERGREDMQRLIKYLGDQPNQTEVLVVGFTDSVGTAAMNQALSERRAAQVRDELLAQGEGSIANISLASKGFGEIAPSGCNEDATGRAINRRVEIWISASEG